MKYFSLNILTLFLFLHLSNGKGYSAEFIREINNAQSDWVAEKNEFTDLSVDEMRKLTGLKKKNITEQIDEFYNYDIEVPNEIPAEFDSRKQWSKCASISSIKDQSNCGSCWAISSSSAMSDRLCISSQFKIQFNLSAEELMTCCNACTGGDPGCDGGYLDETWKYWKKHGLVTGGDYASKEGCQPYAIKPCKNCKYEAKTPKCSKTKCTNKLYKKSYAQDLHKGKSFYKIPQDVTKIQADILKNGPLTTGFIVYKDFMSYKKGVYKYVKGEQIGSHAVRIIGWGVAKNIEQNKKTPYWLVANSWNRSWGDNGLFKIARGTNECEFEENVYAGLPG